MSASAWDRAVEAARRTREFRAGSAFDVPADAVEDFTRAVLAAAIPVLLEELAQRIEAEERLPYAMQRYVRHADVRIVRGFAAEVTK